MFSITPGKWNYKDSILLYPKKNQDLPLKEVVYSSDGKLLLSSELSYKDGKLIQEKYISDGKLEGVTKYEYDKSNRLTRETTKDSSGKITESIDYVYKKDSIVKIRFFTGDGKLYMDSIIHSWIDDLIESGQITWMETKDKEIIKTESKPNKKNMMILDEKKSPIANVEFQYDSKGKLNERIFTQGNAIRKNKLEYDSKGRLSSFSFHVKQDGKWILEKTHKLSY